MARAGIEKNSKYRKLGQRLNGHASGMGEALALGLLETLWNAAYERASEHVECAEDVEADAGWRGEAGAFARHLLDLRLIDESERGGYDIHDFWEHAPPWVKRKAEAAAKRAEQGKTISDIRRAAGKKGQAAIIEAANTPAHDTVVGQNIDQLPAKTLYRDGTGEGRDGTGILPGAANGPPNPIWTLDALWMDLLERTAGDSSLWAPLQRRISAAAGLLKPPRPSGEYAAALVVVFPAFVEWAGTQDWSSTPEVTVRAFSTHFERLERWVAAGGPPKNTASKPRMGQSSESSRVVAGVEETDRLIQERNHIAPAPPPAEFLALRGKKS